MVDPSDEDHPLAYTCRPIRQVKRMAHFCCSPPTLPTAIKLEKAVEVQAPIVTMDEATEVPMVVTDEEETTELSVATIVATERPVTSTATTTTATATAALVVLSTSTTL